MERLSTESITITIQSILQLVSLIHVQCIIHWILIYLIKCYPMSEQLGPVDVINILLRPCLHWAKFCLFCKKLCQQEAISSANDYFFSPTKIFQSSKMPLRRFGGLQFFVRRQTPLFLESYPSSGHLILHT